MASVVLHALTSLTYVVVAVARRLGLIRRSGSDGVICWLIYAPKGGETQCSGFKFNPHQWTGPIAPRVTRALILRHGLDCLESVEDYLLPRFIDGNPISKYVTFAVLFVEPSMATWYMVPMLPMIDTYDLKLFYTLCTYNSIKRFVLTVSSILWLL